MRPPQTLAVLFLYFLQTWLLVSIFQISLLLTLNIAQIPVEAAGVTDISHKWEATNFCKCA